MAGWPGYSWSGANRPSWTKACNCRGHPVDPDVVTQGIRLAATGTVAEDVSVDLVLEPMRLTCRGCGRVGPIEDHLAMVACTRCGGVDVDVDGTDDVRLESITVNAD